MKLFVCCGWSTSTDFPLSNDDKELWKNRGGGTSTKGIENYDGDDEDDDSSFSSSDDDDDNKNNFGTSLRKCFVASPLKQQQQQEQQQQGQRRKEQQNLKRRRKKRRRQQGKQESKAKEVDLGRYGSSYVEVVDNENDYCNENSNNDGASAEKARGKKQQRKRKRKYKQHNLPQENSQMFQTRDQEASMDTTIVRESDKRNIQSPSGAQYQNYHLHDGYVSDPLQQQPLQKCADYFAPAGAAAPLLRSPPTVMENNKTVPVVVEEEKNENEKNLLYQNQQLRLLLQKKEKETEIELGKRLTAIKGLSDLVKTQRKKIENLRKKNKYFRNKVKEFKLEKEKLNKLNQKRLKRLRRLQRKQQTLILSPQRNKQSSLSSSSSSSPPPPPPPPPLPPPPQQQHHHHQQQQQQLGTIDQDQYIIHSNFYGSDTNQSEPMLEPRKKKRKVFFGPTPDRTDVKVVVESPCKSYSSKDTNSEPGSPMVLLDITNNNKTCDKENVNENVISRDNAMAEIKMIASQMDLVVALDQLKTKTNELQRVANLLDCVKAEVQHLEDISKQQEKRIAIVELERDLFKAEVQTKAKKMKSAASQTILCQMTMTKATQTTLPKGVTLAKQQQQQQQQTIHTSPHSGHLQQSDTKQTMMTLGIMSVVADDEDIYYYTRPNSSPSSKLGDSHGVIMPLSSLVFVVKSPENITTAMDHPIRRLLLLDLSSDAKVCTPNYSTNRQPDHGNILPSSTWDDNSMISRRIVDYLYKKPTATVSTKTGDTTYDWDRDISSFFSCTANESYGEGEI